ncbi:hypothetical protein Misp01_20520 [Microtetraspora sp. NBRC 13810]|uniref:SDR family oxidoreductase n=1 Tax=Microtetraspora sp. NBRC 13810 TaxID=3030990 RepID=UPI0024A1E1BB|nr:NAD(P)H-binding protein [Microtetraspora sp. NBRC 13810]GLW06922.1 hypothetical protein Misp01_20520 [Microtetraspora sp. NBRC 13810]
MDVQTTLILGATGSTGRRLTAILREAGHPVRAASRSGEVRFDWADPATWKPALAGATRLYLMAPDGVPVDPAFVAEATGQGVRRVVLLSSRAIEVMGDERLLAAERTVRESGAEWTVVRPDWFDQNFDEGFFRAPIMAGELSLPLGEQHQVFVDAGDIAAVAAAALTQDGHAGRTYEVTGPRALPFAEALDIIGRATGRKIRFHGEPADYLAEQAAAGAPPAQAEAQAAAWAALRALGDAEPTDTVPHITGRPAKSFESYAADAAARGAWRD